MNVEIPTLESFVEWSDSWKLVFWYDDGWMVMFLQAYNGKSQTMYIPDTTAQMGEKRGLEEESMIDH